MPLNIRVDDFPGTKVSEFDKHNLENYLKFHDVLMNNGVKQYVLGIIPRHTKDKELLVINQIDSIIPALHGVFHFERGEEDYVSDNEFRPYDTIKDIELFLLDAKLRFESVMQRDIFDYIPPHNVLDKKTCFVLNNLGIKNVYGGPGTDYEVYDFVKNNSKLEMRYSKWPFEYGRSDELLNRDKSVEYINNRLKNNEDVWLTLHWPWEWNIGLDNLQKYLSQLKV
jgi:hypothetical protein